MPNVSGSTDYADCIESADYAGYTDYTEFVVPAPGMAVTMDQVFKVRFNVKGHHGWP